jgi:selenocysteine lyase/cysteine desulfurase
MSVLSELIFNGGGAVKWLWGGPGAGYLYVRADLLPRLQPAATFLWLLRRHQN